MKTKKKNMHVEGLGYGDAGIKINESSKPQVFILPTADEHYPLAKMKKAELIEFIQDMRRKLYAQEQNHKDQLNEKNEIIMNLTADIAHDKMEADQYRASYNAIKKNNTRIGVSITAYMSAKFPYNQSGDHSPDSEQEAFLNYLKMYCEDL